MNRRNFIKLLSLAPLVPKSIVSAPKRLGPDANTSEAETLDTIWLDPSEIHIDDFKYIQVGAWGFHPDLAKQICGEDYRP